MEVRVGYKQTEVGLIPKDWEIKPLSELVTFTNGKAHEKYIKEDGNYIVVNSKFISSEGLIRKYSDYYLAPSEIGNILMVMSDVPKGRAIAKCFIVDKDNSYTVNQRICSLKAKSDNPRFLFYLINRNRYYLAFDDGIQQTNLRKDDILSCPLSIPPTIIEQSAIATILSDADALITNLEKLIVKKRNIKQGAMQQLLTSKKRLPGFSGEWEIKNLCEVAEFFHGRGLSKADLGEEGLYKCIHYGQLFTMYNELIREVKSRTDKKDGYFYSKENDVLIPTSDVTPRGLATASCIKENGVVLGGGILIIRFHTGFDGLFFSYFVTQNRTSILKLVKGLTVFHLYAADLAKLEVYFPEHQEQIAISQVLSDMDAEIEELEQKLSKYKLIKQGMMQELLTGKRRLI